MAAVGAVLSIAGGIFGMLGQQKQLKEQKKQEKLRMQQLNLETQRRKRETIRQATVARAEATSNAYNQGAGESSALAGGTAQITAQAGRNVVAANQDYQIGRNIFKSNMKIADAQGQINLGQGISSFGGAFSGALPGLENLFGGGASFA